MAYLKNETPPSTPDFNEIATIDQGRDITRSHYLGPLLEYEDAIVNNRGGRDLLVYEELLRDDQVWAAWSQRTKQLIGWEWGVETGTRRFAGPSAADERARDFVAEVLQYIPFDQITEKMHYGIFYGLGVGEIMYARDGNYVVLDEAQGGVKVRKARRFRYTPQMELRMVTLTNRWEGEPLDPYKFWDFCAGADNDDDPYGRALGNPCYWPVTIKRQGMQAWLLFLRKAGVPFVLGKYPQGATLDEQQRLKGVVAGFASGNGGIVPDGMLLELIEATRSGTPDNEALQRWCDRAIAKAILGETMTLEAEGGQYKGDIHSEILDGLIKSDADLLCHSFGRKVVAPLLWFNRANFGEDVAVPQVWRRKPADEDEQRAAKVLVDLKAAGYEPVDIEFINTTFGGEWQRVAAPAVEPGTTGGPTVDAPTAELPDPQPEFAQAEPVPVDQAELDAYLESLTDEELQAQLEPIIAPLIAAIERGDGLEELATLFPNLEEDGLVQVLERAFFVAELWGRVSSAADPGV